MSHAVHIGTSGWSYKHWRKRFYPEELKPAEYLAYYARYFSTTEINTSFYHLPKKETVLHWAETVKADFRFSPKISRYITHTKKLLNPEDTLPAFFERFNGVKKRLGMVLVQLPPNLTFHAERAAHFYKILKQYKGYAFALEARHESWMEPDSLQLLESAKISLVIAESGGRWPYEEALTGKAVYIRLHGPKGYDSAYTDTFLDKLAGKIKKWQKQQPVWVYFNNDGHGYALDNAQKLQQLLQ